MSAISDSIERFIQMLFEEGNGVELRRNELAQHFGCAPSQINYVLSTRFTLDKGYIITSKRGGGGYISIVRLAAEEDLLRDLVTSRIGSELTLHEASAMISRLIDQKLVTVKEGRLMLAAVHDIAMVSPSMRNHIRSGIFKNMLMELMQSENL